MAERHRSYSFNSGWEEQYCFIEYRGKPVCLLCNGSVSIPKKSNVERHFLTNYRNFNNEFPVKSELRKQNLKDLKSKLTLQQCVFTKPIQQSSNVTIASYKICHVLAKSEKPFSNGEIVKEAMISAGESLFDGHKDKSALMTSIRGLQLCHKTVARRVEQIFDNLESQIHQDLQSCEYFSLQLDESPDISDVAQLCVFVRMVFGDFTVREEFVKLPPLHERTRGEDIMNVFLKFVKECNSLLSKLVAITTDGAISITVTRVVDYIRSSSTRYRLFRNLLSVSDTEHGDIIFHADIRWLKLDEISWLLDLAFLTDITSKLNELTLELQGKVRNISSMISVVNAFQKKLQLWIAHLNRNSFSHFPHMKSVL
ncbi:hypothetical protein B7P43_G16172 [Cryptotermes secundus]|uniref:DUF4371 domain-containing protein n=1 Tax=Cryptotermes secundus TaxID=105785 RepID=A0A2J7PDS8_9NEOP|nr:hypothetical protein B7P43_G16172 [Cryptotermes secundus]